jgi:hypothetical protein
MLFSVRSRSTQSALLIAGRWLEQMPESVSPLATLYVDEPPVDGVAPAAGVVEAPGVVPAAGVVRTGVVVEPGVVPAAGVVPASGVWFAAATAAVGVRTTGRSPDSPSLPVGWTMSQIASSAAKPSASSDPRYRLNEGTPVAGWRQEAQTSSPWSSQ